MKTFTMPTMGLWHPFGPHGGETAEQILQRKRGEIQRNGWTLSLFQYRRPESLAAWAEWLSKSPSPVVFCGNIKGTDSDASGRPTTADVCKSFRFVAENKWHPFPTAILSPHPFRGTKREAAAFVVSTIFTNLEGFTPPAVEWLYKMAQWRRDGSVPTHGEYLVRAGGEHSMWPVRAILELEPPYLAVVFADRH